MKSNTLMLRRRHLLIAGLAGAATPTLLFAGQCGMSAHDPLAPPTVADLASTGTPEKLLVSGRVIGHDCRPLAGALVEVWHEGSKERASVTTDADGRFMVTTNALVRGRARPFKIRVSHGGQKIVTQRYFSREPGVSDELVARLDRDDAGVWRTTLGLTLA